METIKKGSKGDNVKKIQKLLGLKEDGDFGKNTESAVKEWQKKHNLTADGIIGEKTWDLMFPTNDENKTETGQVDESVVYKPITSHISKKDRSKITYLVIHFTAGGSSKEGAAMSTRSVFLNREASADFVVDDKTMVQINPNLNKYYCWAVGDGHGKYGITNSNSISIEICSNLKKGTTAKAANHEGWYFTEDSVDNALKLSIILMKKFNIPLDNVVRHYDASRKLCPGIVGWNTGYVCDSVSGKKTNKKSGEEKWVEFKDKLKKELDK